MATWLNHIGKLTVWSVIWLFRLDAGPAWELTSAGEAGRYVCTHTNASWRKDARKSPNSICSPVEPTASPTSPGENVVHSKIREKKGSVRVTVCGAVFLPFEDKKFTKLKLKCILCRLSKTGACGGSNFAHKRSLQRNQFWSHLVWQDVVLNSNSLNRTRRESALQKIPVFPSHLRRYSVLR